jgi:GMP synthase-like glutamine amidotransferase
MMLIVDLNSERNAMSCGQFVDPLRAVCGEAEVRHYTEAFDPSAFSRIILAGTPLKDSDYLSRPERFLWLRECRTPVLGICAGMQSIAAAFGGKTIRCQEIGMTEIETVVDNPLMSGRFKAYSLHNMAAEVPSDFTVLAKSALCAQAMRHKSRPLYGVLFHPEVRNPGILAAFVGSPGP